MEGRVFGQSGGVFAFLLFIISYKLTNASLWGDEVTEFFYSKYLFEMPDSVPDMGWNLHNMYERIVFTYQPPLYNIIMFFWLKISESEWWLRAFGVLMGLFGGIGTFQSIKKITNSEVVSAASVCLYALNYRQTYYWQEAAEYCLMLGLMPWIIFAFLSLIESPGKRNINLVVILCILAVYSQYGAVFPAISVLLLTFIFVAFTQNKELIFHTLLIYLNAALFTALPLYHFFLKEQMARQGSSLKFLKHFNWGEFIENTKYVFEWNMVSSIGESGKKILAIVGIILLIYAFIYIIKGRKISFKYLLTANLICYIAYYLCVIWGAYAAGAFGVRYNVFLIPLWFITGIGLLYELVSSLKSFMVFSLLKAVPFFIEGKR